MKNFTLILLIATSLLFIACEEKTTAEKVENKVPEIVSPKTDSEKAMDSLKDASDYASKVIKEESQKAMDATAKKAAELKKSAGETMDDVVAAVKEKAIEISDGVTTETAK